MQQKYANMPELISARQLAAILSVSYETARKHVKAMPRINVGFGSKRGAWRVSKEEVWKKFFNGRPPLRAAK